jgi:hypothetical protein
LGQADDDSTGLVSTTDRAATDFFTGGSATIITGATLRMTNLDTIGHSFDVHIYTNSANSDASPTFGSTLVGTLSGGTISDMAFSANVNFTDTGIALAANTKYWVVLEMLEALNGDPVFWFQEPAGNVDAGSSFLDEDATYSQLSGDAGDTWFPFSFGNHIFSLSGIVAAPEPSRALLASFGLLGLMLRRRR